MPLSGKKKAAYQRELMAKRRAKTGETDTRLRDMDDSKLPPAMVRMTDTRGRISTAKKPPLAKPYRAPNGNLILEPPSRPYDTMHIHEYRRRVGEETAMCKICSEVVRYEGKPMNIYNDKLPDWPQLIRESPNADEIQRKMPVTQKRDQR